MNSNLFDMYSVLTECNEARKQPRAHAGEVIL